MGIVKCRSVKLIRCCVSTSFAVYANEADQADNHAFSNVSVPSEAEHPFNAGLLVVLLLLTKIHRRCFAD